MQRNYRLCSTAADATIQGGRQAGSNPDWDVRIGTDGQHGSNDASEHKNPLLLQGFTPNFRYKLGTTKEGK